MACLAYANGSTATIPQPAGGWTKFTITNLVGPSPVVKTLDTAAGLFTFVTSGEAVFPNLRATLETRVHLLGDVLVIPPGEVINRSQ